MPRKPKATSEAAAPDTATSHGPRAAWRSLETVFSRPVPIFIALAGGLLSVGLAFWLPNIGLLKLIFASAGIGLWQKVSFLFEMYQVLFTTLNAIQLVMILLLALLFGVVLSLLVITGFRRHKGTIDKDQTAVGLTVGVVGCGTGLMSMTLLTPVVTLTGAGVSLGAHFLGTLLGLLSILLLGWTLVLLGRAIEQSSS